MRKEKREKIVAEVRKHLHEADKDSTNNREKAEEDLRFAFSGDPEDQWEQYAWKQRVDRPRLADNRIEPVIDQLVGEQRQNRPSIKLRATNDETTDQAETLEGLIRNIFATSNAESTFDKAYEYACACGIGGWQVIPDYLDDDGFEQEIVIKPIYNPFSMYWSRSANEETLEDSDFFIIAEWISRNAFESKYPGKTFSSVSDDAEWHRNDSDEVRIADYWKKVYQDRVLLRLSDGRTVFEDEISDIVDELAGLNIEIEQRREVKHHKIQWCKVSGGDVLEGPIVYDWKYIPVVPTFGKVRNIAGERIYKGIVRNSKDSQRSLNYTKSALLESAALAPKTPPIVSAKMIKGYENQWKSHHRVNYPFLVVTPDERMPQGPQRLPTQGIPPELLQLAQIDQEAIKAQTGIFDASLGQTSNETSGKALLARQQQGNTGTYQYLDNLSRSIQHTGRILVDMIPKVYDTERVVRVLGQDGAEKYATINERVQDQETGEWTTLNDLKGRYDVAVTTGPSYSTQRQESAERLIQLAGLSPEIIQIAADLIVKGLDLPDGDELHDRIRKRLIQAGTIEPGDDPEEQQLVEQPDPMQEQQAMLALRALAASVTSQELENALKQAELEQQPAEVQKLLAEVLHKQAQAQKTEAEAAGLI